PYHSDLIQGDERQHFIFRANHRRFRVIISSLPRTPHVRKCAANMAITTDPTQKSSEPRRTDSGVHDSYIGSRPAPRSNTDSARDTSVSKLASDRALGRLRPVS